MKKLVLITLKLILAIIFLYNIGLISYLKNKPAPIMAPQKEDCGRGDVKYLNEKLRRAKILGEEYLAEQYFADVAEIKIKIKNNYFDKRVMPNYFLTTLNSYFLNNLDNLRKYGPRKEYELALTKLRTLSDECQNIVNPGSAEEWEKSCNETKSLKFWKDLLNNFLSWFWNFYYHNLLIGFALLWLWWYEDRDKLKISNPLSFLICLVLYPIVIIRVWYLSAKENGKSFAMLVDFKRRQANIFSLVSEDELATIKKFAKSSLLIGDYKAYLEHRNLSYRHALVPVVLATCVLLIAPKANGAKEKHQSSEATKCQLCIKAPPDFKPGNLFQLDLVLAAIIPELKKVFFLIKFWQTVKVPKFEECVGFKTNPDPIPWFN